MKNIHISYDDLAFGLKMYNTCLYVYMCLQAFMILFTQEVIYSSLIFVFEAWKIPLQGDLWQFKMDWCLIGIYHLLMRMEILSDTSITSFVRCQMEKARSVMLNTLLWLPSSGILRNILRSLLGLAQLQGQLLSYRRRRYSLLWKMKQQLVWEVITL